MVRVTFHSPCSWINSSLLANTSKPICFGQNKLVRHGLFFFPLFFPSVGKEKVYIQPKEKKARTKLCLLCVCSQSSRCLELSAQPSHSFPHQCAIVFIALHSPRIFFASLTLSLVCLIYPHITDIFNQPEPRLSS